MNLLMTAVHGGLALVILAGGVAAQDTNGRSPVSGLVSGFIFDGSTGIRPVLGVPGAATLGRPIARTAGLGAVVFSSSGDYALAVTPRGGQVILLRHLDASVTAEVLQTTALAARVVISPSGDRAVLYHPEPQSVSVVSGLPDAPAVSWSLEVPHLPGGLGALAVSDGGNAVLLAAAADESPVWLLTPTAGARVLSYVSSSSSLAFLPRSSDAVIGDGRADSVMLVRDPTGLAVRTQIGGAAEGLSRPIALEVTPDGSRVLVADAALAGVVSLGLAGEAPLSVTCNCSVAGLERLSGGFVFRLNEGGEAPLWLLDASSSPVRIVFVPDHPASRRRPIGEPIPGRSGVGR
jgi:hypothetical protein